jgi:predicted XRE-type DNA-binding protein
MSEPPIIFRESYGNVFADLVLEDADDLLAKAELALAIRSLIEQMSLNQTQAAKRMGTTQARVSELYNAKVMKMTFDRLLGFLKALDCDTYITVTEHGTGVSEKQGRTIVKAF